jgi:MFS family permease
MKRKNSLRLLLVILMIGYLFRLYKIDNPIADWHEFRQADTSSVSRFYLANGINLFAPHYQDISNIQSGKDNPEGYRFVEFPIYNALTAVFAARTGITIEYTGRFLSVIFSIVTLLGLFILARKWWGEKTALCVVLFAATNAYFVYYSRVIMPDPLMIGLGVWSLVFLDHYLIEPRIIWAILSAALFGLAVLVKPYIGFWYIGIFGAMFLLKKWRPLIVLGCFYGIALIPFALWRQWESLFPEGMPAYTWLFNGDGIRFRPAFFRWILYERITKLILGWGGVALLLAGLKTSMAKRSFLAWGMLVGSAIYVFTLATGNVRHDYYQALIFPPLALFIGSGLAWLAKDNQVGRIAAAGLLTLSFVLGWHYVGGYYQINHPEIVEAGEAADRILPKNARVVAPYDGDTAFLYYTDRFGWPLGYDIDQKIQKGATAYVSVNFDQETKDLMTRYAVIVRTPKYVIIDLTRPKLL